MRLIVVLLGVGLVVAVGLSGYLFNRADSYYRELNAVRLDPSGLAAYSPPR